MGGKRPDQYRIDYDEAGTTDYKFYPDEPAEGERDALPYNRTMKGKVRAQQPIASRAPEPEAERKRLDEWERQRHVHREEAERTHEPPKGGEPEPPGGPGG